MATLRMILAAFVAVFSLSFPSLANAQRVHEVRPASQDEVRIGTETNASLEDIVALSRRISDNPELTAEDVTANNAHIRYVCRVDGRQVYFGHDSSYGGARCPEDAVRSHDGVIRHSVYRVPRVHGATLPPAAYASVPMTDAAVDDRLAAAEVRIHAALETAERAVTERDAMRTARDHAATELERLRHAPPPEPQIHMEFVQDPAQASEIARLQTELARVTHERDEALARPSGEADLASSLYGRPLWALILLVIAVMTGLGLVLFGSVILPRIREAYHRAIRKRFIRKINRLKDDLLYADRASKEDAKAIERLKRRYARLRSHTVGWLAARETALSELKAFTDRLREIPQLRAQLVPLRKLEDDYDMHVVHLDQARKQKEEALKLDDSEQAKACDKVIAVHEELIRKYKNEHDPDALKTQIAIVTKDLLELFQAQCGLEFEERPALEIKLELEDRLRQELRLAMAARTILGQERLEQIHSYERELGEKKAILEREFAAKESEAVEALRKELEAANLLLEAARGEPNAYGKVIFGMELKLADLQRDVELARSGDRWSAPSLPATEPLAEESATPDEEGSSLRPVRPRRTTSALVRTELDSEPLPHVREIATRRELPLLLELGAFLDQAAQTANGGHGADRVLKCDEHEARDLLYFLHNYSVSSPLHEGAIRLRKFVVTMANAGYEALLEKRRDTIPPGAAAPT